MDKNLFEQIKLINKQLSIIEVAERRVDHLTRTSKNTFKGRSIYSEDRDPSMVLYEKTNTFYCFANQKFGRPFDLYRDFEGLTNYEAILRIKEDFLQLNIPELKIEDNKIPYSEEELKILEILYWVQMLGHHELVNSAEHKLYRNYLYRRGFSDADISFFGLGAITDDHRLWELLNQKGIDIQSLINFEIFDYNKKFKLRERILVPNYDKDANVIDFDARAINSRTEPKYNRLKNIVNHANLSKERSVHSFQGILTETSYTHELIVVEGVFDIMRLSKLGLKNVIGAKGANLSRSALDLLNLHKKSRIVLFYDNDEAGNKATLSSAINLFKNDFVNVFNVDKRLDYTDPDNFFLAYKDSVRDYINQNIKNMNSEVIDYYVELVKTNPNADISQIIDSTKIIFNTDYTYIEKLRNAIVEYQPSGLETFEVKSGEFEVNKTEEFYISMVLSKTLNLETLLVESLVRKARKNTLKYNQFVLLQKELFFSITQKIETTAEKQPEIINSLVLGRSDLLTMPRKYRKYGTSQVVVSYANMDVLRIKFDYFNFEITIFRRHHYDSDFFREHKDMDLVELSRNYEKVPILSSNDLLFSCENYKPIDDDFSEDKWKLFSADIVKNAMAKLTLIVESYNEAVEKTYEDV